MTAKKTKRATSAKAKPAKQPVVVQCGLPTCPNTVTQLRKTQRFCSAKCRLAAFELESGTRTRWKETAQELADVLRLCVASDALSPALEKRATAALHQSMPHRINFDRIAAKRAKRMKRAKKP